MQIAYSKDNSGKFTKKRILLITQIYDIIIRQTVKAKNEQAVENMEWIIWLMILIPVSAFFSGIGIYAMKLKKPMWQYRRRI